jgi:hypothetical protein
MIQVTSYIKENLDLVPANEFSGSIMNPKYIEGAICLRVAGKEILDIGMEDLVDQLWCYIVDAAVQSKRVGMAEFYFPDQPIKVTFVRRHDTVTITVQGNSRRHAALCARSFDRGIAEAAAAFFSVIFSVLPDSRERYSQTISQLGLL